MEYNESNFFYLRNTSLEKYYDALVKAEYVCEYFPIITRIIVRKVLESFIKDIAEKYSIESNVAAWQLINNIKVSERYEIPDEIYRAFEIILVNAYDHSSYNRKPKGMAKHPIEILEIIHNIFCWYLKSAEIQEMALTDEASFRAPSTIEYMKKEIIKIDADVMLKGKQINVLRQAIIEQSSELKNISEMNNKIIAIKEEKACLEKIYIGLNRKVEAQRKQVLDLEKDYNTYIKKIENLREKCNESQELIFAQESQLVKAEIQKQEVSNLIKKLEEKDDSINILEQYLEKELEIARKAYENLVDLTKKYEDNLETVEFSYDKDLQKILENEQKNIMIKINYEDKIFNDNVITYSQNIIEAKRKTLIFKEILNEKIRKEIKYEQFYRAFLNIEGKELRIVYIIATSINLISSTLNKSKELLTKSTKDKLLELVNRRLEELKNISDAEIRLVLYYKLIKLANIPSRNVFNRRQFVQALDTIVEKGYEFLINKADFKGKINKIDGISLYYIEKVLEALKSKSNLQVDEELVNRIYENIMELKSSDENIDKRQIHYEKYNLDNITEALLKDAIRAHPFELLSIMINLGSSYEYLEFQEILLYVEGLIEKKLEVNTNEYFMSLMFLASRVNGTNDALQENLLPILLMEIINVDLIAANKTTNLENYKDMINIWKQKQHRYNDISMEKEDKENEIKFLIKEKQELEINQVQLMKNYDMSVEKYNNYKEEFKNIIMNSEKRILLPSFMIYDELRSKKEVAEKHINESKDKFGTFKSMISPGIWKEKASKFLNETNMVDAEKALIEEAKQKPYFMKEYSVFQDLENQISNANELINKNQENIQNKNLLVENITKKINDLDKQLNTIKELYLDIEAIYY
ncbi:hypothetical protein [Clostridium saccharoperbutylacetonicum]|uniref:hypothetical protein n=1 Tax=Clostridium saccharoperbutylacetonicum TaxID=36745 RepID=UPI0039EC35CF